MTDLTPARPRMIVPDAARGMALLGIALANAPTAWLLSDQFDVAASFGGVHDGNAADTYLGLVSQNLGNLAFMAFGYLFFVVPYFPVMIIGFVWARRGVLADVTAHRRELAAWLWAGIAVVVLVGLPWGLSTLQVLPAAWEDPLMMANQTFGVLTGPAILAGLALVLDGMQKRIDAGAATPGLLVPFVALGKRSMSGYLMQSIVFFVLTQPFLLNMGHNVGAFAEAGIAIAVWASTLLTAWALEAAGKPGPFEWAHRRLSYGKTMRPELSAGR